MYLVVEDYLSEALSKRLLQEHGITDDQVYSIGFKGKDWIRQRIDNWINIGADTNIFLLTDLDNEYGCAPNLVTEWAPWGMSTNAKLRVAVREVESWVIADRRSIAKYLSVSEAIIPRDVELDTDPKQTLINIARRSRSRRIREGMVPRDEGAQKGPAYNPIMTEFVNTIWQPQIARNVSDSLDRAMRAIETL